MLSSLSSRQIPLVALLASLLMACSSGGASSDPASSSANRTKDKTGAGGKDGSQATPEDTDQPSLNGNSSGVDCKRQDGKVDQAGCACQMGATQKCFVGDAKMAGVGVCAFGTQSCVASEDGGEVGAANVWGPCTGSGKPQVEVCDEIDQNCNGDATDGCPCQDKAVEGCMTSDGKSGQRTCQGGSWGACTPSTTTTCTPSGPEVCDGIDNDCDGQVDGIVDTAGCDFECQGGGERVCSNGSFSKCTCGCQPVSCSTLCGVGERKCDADGKLGPCEAPPVQQTCVCADGSPGSATCTNGQVGACKCAPPTQPPSDCLECVKTICPYEKVAEMSMQLGNNTSQCKGAYDDFLQCLQQGPGLFGDCDQDIGGCDGSCGCGNIIRLAYDCASFGLGTTTNCAQQCGF